MSEIKNETMSKKTIKVVVMTITSMREGSITGIAERGITKFMKEATFTATTTASGNGSGNGRESETGRENIEIETVKRSDTDAPGATQMRTKRLSLERGPASTTAATIDHTGIEIEIGRLLVTTRMSDDDLRMISC